MKKLPKNNSKNSRKKKELKDISVQELNKMPLDDVTGLFAEKLLKNLSK